MLSGSNNNAEENSGRQEVRGKWGKSEQGRLHGGGDTGSWNQERGEAGKRAAPPRGWGHILGCRTRDTQPPKGLSWGERVAEVPDLSNLGDLWSKGRNKQAYHGTERQDIERQSSLHSSGLLSRLIRVLRKQGCVEGEERGVRPSCLPRHEKLSNGIFIMKPVTKTNAC